VGVRVLETASSALLSPQTAGSFVREFDYTINPYGGCAFACSYCYVPSVLRGRAERMGGWGTYVEARVRAPAVLARQRHLLVGRSFFCASATDPWQPAERRYELTRRLLEILAGVPFTFGLFSTRSPLVLRDLDLLGAMAERIEVGISLPTDREDIRPVFEPRNPPVAARLETARRLREAGIAVRLHVSPALPATAAFPRLAGEVADWVWWIGRRIRARTGPSYIGSRGLVSGSGGSGSRRKPRGGAPLLAMSGSRWAGNGSRGEGPPVVILSAAKDPSER